MRQAGAAGTAVHHSPPPAPRSPTWRARRAGASPDRRWRSAPRWRYRSRRGHASPVRLRPWVRAETPNSGGLLHHLSDLLGYCQRQPQRLTDDLIDRFPGCTIDHQVSFLARREESRIIEHGLKRAAQRREPLWRHARRGENGAADFAGAGGRVQDLAAFVRLRELREGWHVWEQAMPLDRGLVEDGRFTPLHPAG